MTEMAADYMRVWHNLCCGLSFQLNGDGDGTVNIRSLRVCAQWRTLQRQPVYHREFHQAEHMQILHNSDVVDYIYNLAMSRE